MSKVDVKAACIEARAFTEATVATLETLFTAGTASREDIKSALGLATQALEAIRTAEDKLEDL